MAQYFNLTLDTLAPQNGVLSGLNSYYNSNATVTLSADGAADAATGAKIIRLDENIPQKRITPNELEKLHENEAVPEIPQSWLSAGHRKVSGIPLPVH